MNRRRALGKILAGFAATTTVSAKDFDPTVGRGGMAEVVSGEVQTSSSIDYIWELEEKMPPRIRSGFRWLKYCEETSILGFVDEYRPRDLIPALLPRRVYRSLLRSAHFKRLDACRPDLTDEEWSQCKALFDGYQKIDDSRKLGFDLVQKALLGLKE